jgi:DNA-binding NarL/FixJ family response regulator
MEVVGEASDGHEAVGAVDHLRPHVVIMDVNMPKMNGIEATTRIKARYPEIIIIGLSVNTEGENREMMIKAGAAALLTKEAVVETLYGTIMQQVEKFEHAG